MLYLLPLLFCLNPISQTDTKIEYFDRIHFNHLFDASGRYIFSQILFENLQNDGKYHIEAWRLLKDSSIDGMIHLKDETGHHLRIFDEDGNFLLQPKQKVYDWRGHKYWPIEQKTTLIKNGQVTYEIVYITTIYENDVILMIVARSRMMTWTNYDPELLDRNEYPKEYRKELGRGVKLGNLVNKGKLITR